MSDNLWPFRCAPESRLGDNAWRVAATCCLCGNSSCASRRPCRGRPSRPYCPCQLRTSSAMCLPSCCWALSPCVTHVVKSMEPFFQVDHLDDHSSAGRADHRPPGQADGGVEDGDSGRRVRTHHCPTARHLPVAARMRRADVADGFGARRQKSKIGRKIGAT